MKILFITILGISLFGAGCRSKHEYSIHDSGVYEENKASLEKAEKNHPEKFLIATGTHKRNLLGQTVVKGNIFNHAKMVHFKDVSLKMSFYSSTRTLLEEDRQTIYESVAPGGSIRFKTKYFAPKATDSVAIAVIAAKH